MYNVYYLVRTNSIFFSVFFLDVYNLYCDCACALASSEVLIMDVFFKFAMRHLLCMLASLAQLPAHPKSNFDLCQVDKRSKRHIQTV